MNKQMDRRQIFLIASVNDLRRMAIETMVSTQVPTATIFQASDGLEAWSKIENVPPDVIILDSPLPRQDPLQLVDAVLSDRKHGDSAIILLAHPPAETQTLVDEIVTGRVQFVGDEKDSPRLQKAIVRALNYVASRYEAEFRLKFLSGGETLLKQGDVATTVFLLRKGRLQVIHCTGEEKIPLGIIEPGEFVGEMAYINEEPRSADVFALTACELIEIPIDHLDHVLYRKPAWSKALMTTLSKRIKRSNDKTVAEKK